MIYFPISPKVVASELYFLHVLPLFLSGGSNSRSWKPLSFLEFSKGAYGKTCFNCDS